MKGLAPGLGRRVPFVEDTAPSTTYTDDFNRANENPLAGDWTKPTRVNGLKLDTNRVTAITTNGIARLKESAIIAADDQEAEIEWRGGSAGPCVRIKADADCDCYFFTTTGSILQLYSYSDNGTTVTVATMGPTVVYAVGIGDTLRLSATGHTPVVLQGYVNGVLALTYNDNTNLSITGMPGVGVFNTSGFADNFSATCFPPPPFIPFYSYLRPGGVDTYYRPGGIDRYIRP